MPATEHSLLPHYQTNGFATVHSLLSAAASDPLPADGRHLRRSRFNVPDLDDRVRTPPCRKFIPTAGSQD